MSFMKAFEPFRGSYNRHKFNRPTAVLFDKIHSLNSRAAGCKHRISHHNRTQFNRAWKLAIVFVRLMGYLVAVETDMAYFGRRNQCQNAVYHSKACAQDRNNSKFFS